MAELPVLVKKR